MWEIFVSKHLYLLEYFLYIVMFNMGEKWPPAVGLFGFELYHNHRPCVLFLGIRKMMVY